MVRKITLFCLAFVLCISVFAQVPNAFKYQAVIRNSSGEILPNQNISLRISILDDNALGPNVYSETHSVTTNDVGTIAIDIGKGSPVSGDFSTINWSTGDKYLKTEIDVNGGSSYVRIGTTQLLSVPYALYANNVSNKDDADADPTNEIQDLVLVGDTLALSNGNKIVLPYDSSNWVINGNSMYYNGGNVGIGSSAPVSNLEVKSNTSGDEALFLVISASNDTVFAVYPDGVQITAPGTVKDGDKGKKRSAFVVSGRGTKGSSNDYLIVTDDSTRIYITDTTNTKGKVGGFAISGRSPAKGVKNDYLQVTRDSTRVYITESAEKGKVGGFAISGRSPAKGIETDYFNVSGNTAAEVINNEARVMWYPKKAALLAGEVHVGSADSVGTNSTALGYQSISKGDYSQAFGYKSFANGNNSTAIGNNANAMGNESYAFGNFATAQDSGSYAIGSGALASGLRSFALGSTGVDSAGLATSSTQAIGDYSYAFGMGSIASGQGAFAIGTQDTASGEYSTSIGYYTKANNWGGTAMGAYTTASGEASTATGVSTIASGVASTAMGFSTIASNIFTTAIGWYSEAQGDYSTAIGFNTIASGYASMSLGASTEASGTASTSMGANTRASGDMSTAMGGDCTASGDYSTAMGYRASTNNFKGSFIYGDKSTGSLINSTAADQFMVRAAGGTIFYSNSGLSAGVSLSAGGGAWASVSDKNKKENYEDINSHNILDKLSKIDIQSWNYKSQDASIRHIGITAQDFYENFGFGENDITLTWMDVAGINSVSIQELYQNYQDIKKENDELRKENEDIKIRLSQIEKLLITE